METLHHRPPQPVAARAHLSFCLCTSCTVDRHHLSYKHTPLSPHPFLAHSTSTTLHSPPSPGHRIQATDHGLASAGEREQELDFELLLSVAKPALHSSRIPSCFKFSCTSRIAYVLAFIPRTCPRSSPSWFPVQADAPLAAVYTELAGGGPACSSCAARHRRSDFFFARSNPPANHPQTYAPLWNRRRRFLQLPG